jgi:hypothetical protein
MSRIKFVRVSDIRGYQHPYWTLPVYTRFVTSITITPNRQPKDWFRHPRNILIEWIQKLKIEDLFYWNFESLLEQPTFILYILDCLVPFYKHGMHISIIECINIMVDAYVVHKSGCDEYDRDSDDFTEFLYRTLCSDSNKIPWAALCLLVNEPWNYRFMCDDLNKILLRQIRSVYRRTDRPDVFSSLTFDSVGFPKYLESNGIDLPSILNPDGIGYPIKAVFQNNPQYKNFGHLFLNLISENPIIPIERFFNLSLNYLIDTDIHHSELLKHFYNILQNQCKDVVFTKKQFDEINTKFLKAFPNSRILLMFSGFLFQNFLRNQEISLKLRKSRCLSFQIKLEPSCIYIQFESHFVKKIKMLGFLEILMSKQISNQHSHLSYSIMRRVVSGLFL